MEKHATDLSNQLKDILSSAHQVAVITHEHIDHDAVCSLLLMKTILTKYAGIPSVSLFVQEETWPQFENLGLEGLDSITNIPPGTKATLAAFELIIIVDSFRSERSVQTDEPIPNLFRRSVIIDHHGGKPESPCLMYLDEGLSSTCEQIYTTFKKITPTIADDCQIAYLVQLGIVGDTGRFLHQDIITPNTFKTMAELYTTHRFEFERIHKILNEKSAEGLLLMKHLFENMKTSGECVYSFIDPEYTDGSNYTKTDYDTASAQFIDITVRATTGMSWGFICRKEPEKDSWRVKLQASGDLTDVRIIAKRLGGGGHASAAGAVFTAPSMEDAISKVLSAASPSS